MKSVGGGDFAKDLERTAAQVRGEANEFNLPPAGLSKDGKRLLPCTRDGFSVVDHSPADSVCRV